MDDDILIDTDYGPHSVTAVAQWRVVVCPKCGREHAHPPEVSAYYWPQCWDCWSGWAMGAGVIP